MVKFLDILFFTKHLSVMLKSGITIVEALAILETQSKSATFKKVIHTVSTDIQNGQSLAIALSKHPKVFNQLYINLISVGEQTGKLDDDLIYLADELTKERAFKQKVHGALIYPIVVLIAALAVGIGVSVFALPKLLDLFSGIDVTLPLPTKILLAISAFMKNYGIIFALGIFLLIIIVRLLFMSKTTKPFFDNLVLSLPLFGKISQETQLALLCRNLGIMLRSGLTIPTTLDVASKSTDNNTYKNYMKRLLDAVTNGKSLVSEFDQGTYPKIPLIATKMIAVGEKTGKLDETFVYLSDFFEDSVEDSIKNLTTLLEPILLLIIGVVVGFVALSIIAPIYSLTGSINP